MPSSYCRFHKMVTVVFRGEKTSGLEALLDKRGCTPIFRSSMHSMYCHHQITITITNSPKPIYSDQFTITNSLHHHQFNTTNSPKPVHYHQFSITNSLHHHQFTITNSPKPIHSHKFTITNSLHHQQFKIVINSKSLSPIHYWLFTITITKSLSPLHHHFF